MNAGSFDGISLEDERLVYCRPEGHPQPTIGIGRGEGLSEGIYDQVFLALRLALLSEQIEQAGPVPVVFDDVLMSFDDERALAAMECFAQLATATQVLLFTHHCHLGDLVRSSALATRVAIVSLT